MEKNTPSVHNCHGWKLGEYLAMGKAIISTPISNELPENLVHGKNIYITSAVKSARELEQAIRFLLNNSSYRQELEVHAREYYCKYVTPDSVIDKITTN